MPGHGSLGPGPIEVRLLVPVPRIDGLSEPLPAKRARRATELVAYLALHHPTPITSDRLRNPGAGLPRRRRRGEDAVQRGHGCQAGARHRIRW